LWFIIFIKAVDGPLDLGAGHPPVIWGSWRGFGEAFFFLQCHICRCVRL
jgi:hypothetical protein